MIERKESTKQIADKMNSMTTAAILYWVKKGCPCDKKKRLSGRTLYRFNEQEVRNWANEYFGNLVDGINKVMEER